MPAPFLPLAGADSVHPRLSVDAALQRAGQRRILRACSRCGLSIIFGMLRIVNFAHGTMYMLGAFVAYYGAQFVHLPFFCGLDRRADRRRTLRPRDRSDAAAAAHDSGPALQPVVHLRPRAHHRRRHAAAAGALGSPYETPGAACRRDEPRLHPLSDLPALLDRRLHCACASAVYFVIERTMLGARIRAATEKPELTRAFGIDTSRLVSGVFAFGVALAAFAGVLERAETRTSRRPWATAIIIQTFAIVVIGGLGSILGSIVAGFRGRRHRDDWRGVFPADLNDADLLPDGRRAALPAGRALRNGGADRVTLSLRARAARPRRRTRLARAGARSCRSSSIPCSRSIWSASRWSRFRSTCCSASRGCCPSGRRCSGAEAGTLRRFVIQRGISSFVLAVLGGVVFSFIAVARGRGVRGAPQRHLFRDDHAGDRADRVLLGLPARRRDRRGERPADCDARYAVRPAARERPRLLLSRPRRGGVRDRFCDPGRHLTVRASAGGDARKRNPRAEHRLFARVASRSRPSCFRDAGRLRRRALRDRQPPGGARRRRLAHLGRDRHDDDSGRHRHDLRSDRRRRGLSVARLFRFENRDRRQDESRHGLRFRDRDPGCAPRHRRRDSAARLRAAPAAGRRRGRP